MEGLGDRIRVLRKERRLTLVEVARRTGIDQATLSRIETGVMTGTLNSHMKIAGVLGIPLPRLYEKVVNRGLEEKERRFREKLGSFSHSSGAVAELLTTSILQKKMLPILLKLQAHGRTEVEEFSAGAERFVYVIRGRVETHIGAERRTLAAGEGLYFEASKPHHFRNTLKTESWCLSVVTPASL